MKNKEPTRTDLLEKVRKLELEAVAFRKRETRFKEEERRLRKSERLYRAVVDDQIDLINRSLPDLTLTFVNKAHCNYYGKSPEELIGVNIILLIPPAAGQKLKRLILKITPADPIAIHEHEVVLPDGDVRFQHWVNRGIFDKKGTLVEILAVGRDITERRRAELALKASEERLIAQKQALEQKNAALQEVLEQIGNVKLQLKENIMRNVDQLLLPIVHKIRRRAISPEVSNYVNILQQNVENLTSPFGRVVSSSVVKLSAREIEISSLSKNGLTSKEIGELLHIASRTVDTYRYKIRRKFGLIGKKINSATFLREIAADGKNSILA